MKIAVCVKQVPGVSSVKIDPETKRLVRDEVVSVINPFDYYALEQAIQLRERHGGEVVAVSMGPAKAVEALRECLAFGADRAVLLSDRKFAGSDTWATSYVLALAIRKLGGVDLVLCGKQAIDGDTAQVGSGIAAHLDWTQASGVSAMELSEGGRVSLKRMKDDGYDRCSAALPSVVSVLKELNEPRVPRLSGWLRAVSAQIEAWDAEAIGADPSCLGLKGSTRLFEGSSADAARALFKELRAVSAI